MGSRVLIFFLGISLFTTLACSSKDTRISLANNENYDELIEDYTASAVRYEGFYNKFEVRATILNSTVSAAQVVERTNYHQWTPELSQRERDKSFQDMSSAATFFLSFFSPETEYNDLHKPDTIWKLFLDADGRRYEGKVTKLKDKFSDLKTLYPYLDRFSTGYLVSFPIPMSVVEKNPSKLLLTSSLGSAAFEFRPVP